jgi:hypothetical protein
MKSSDKAIAVLMAADIIVLNFPLYNFRLPSYDFLSTIISREIYRRKIFLSRIVKKSLSVEQKQIPDSLLEKKNQPWK